jgi:hypothetical protein
MMNGKEIAFSCFVSGSAGKMGDGVVSDDVGCGSWRFLAR